MHRFFLKNINLNDSEINITDVDLIYQINKVLRLKLSQEISVFDGQNEYLIMLKRLEPKKIIGDIVKIIKNKAEANINLNLYQALLKQDHFELVIKHGTSLGIKKFIPLITERTISRQMSEHKFKRWQKIAQEATEQSGRLIIPEINEPISLNKILSDKSALNLVAWEGAKNNLSKILPSTKPETINLFVGPEGGWSENEIKILEKFGTQSFLFGPRILRAEFAGLAIASALFYKFN
ncbi:MAG: RsmE family RNA methyltransferase [Patescibacteria group bacterium]|nr:RsmE family RNA methyltransferase [Patescibacteria group bacterium]MDD5121198.1 RsmE family RNA methyltransferase [Patescibacteria group bacterium]MDD5395883.1 RsmE family RNA methyltransferase [Patescibacteria group bacterium]